MSQNCSLELSDTILIVEDDGASFQLMRDIVKDMGFAQVERARNGADALEKLRKGSYGLVISDWRMTPMSGLELLKSIRADRYLSALPFMMLTGLGDPAHASLAKEAGATDYIVKPFSVKTVRRKISRLLDR